MRLKFLTLILLACLFLVLEGCATASPPVLGPVSHKSLIDGEYESSYRSGPVKVITKVTIAGQRITNVELLQHRTWKGKSAENVIPARIIENQSTEVDVVSGASMSSQVIMNAVQDALNKAMKK